MQRLWIIESNCSLLRFKFSKFLDFLASSNTFSNLTLHWSFTGIGSTGMALLIWHLFVKIMLIFVRLFKNQMFLPKVDLVSLLSTLLRNQLDQLTCSLPKNVTTFHGQQDGIIYFCLSPNKRFFFGNLNEVEKLSLEKFIIFLVKI